MDAPKIICPNCLPKPQKLGFQGKKTSLGVCSSWFDSMTEFVGFDLEFGFLSIEFTLVKCNLGFGAKKFSLLLKVWISYFDFFSISLNLFIVFFQMSFMSVDPLEKILKIRGIISWSNRLDKKQENLSYFGEFFLHLEE